MSPSRDLPARPSLDSLRKQAKRLAKDAAAEDAAALARVRAQLPGAPLPLSLRDAQLVLAREYGFAGWADLTAEVRRRAGDGLEWAVDQAAVAIHDRDDERLRALLAEHPELVSWQNEASGQTLLDYTTSYAMNCTEPEREHTHTRPLAAEMLIDAGAVVQRKTWEHVIKTGARGMLALFARENVMPAELPVLAALGDEVGVRARLAGARAPGGPTGGSGGLLPVRDDSEDPFVVSFAMLSAARFGHASVARLLLDRSIELDAELGERIDRWGGRDAFVRFLFEHTDAIWQLTPDKTPWMLFVHVQLQTALRSNDLAAFRRWLDQEHWVLDPAHVDVQNRLIQEAAYSERREAFIEAMLQRDPAILKAVPLPRPSAISNALAYGNAHLVPMLMRIWPLPDDLPHAAGIGNAAAVARWFDASGKPALGSLSNHFPGSDPSFPLADLGWKGPTVQIVLDTALAWAVRNHHFEIAELLLERGADIDTDWSTHEPASILHEAAIHGDEEAVRFLASHGADLDKKDFRYESNAEGWARYGSGDERMAELLAGLAATRREQRR